MHKSGFIHYDIKPENICRSLDDNDDRVVLIDFGGAQPWPQTSNNLSRPIQTVEYSSKWYHEFQGLSRRQLLPPT